MGARSWGPTSINDKKGPQVEGKSFSLINDAPAPYTMGGQYLAEDVMLFKVTKSLSGKDTSSLPETLVPFEPLNPTYATRERLLRVSEKERPSDGYVIIGLLRNARGTSPSPKIAGLAAPRYGPSSTPPATFIRCTCISSSSRF